LGAKFGHGKAELGGGALLDADCYCANAIRFMMGAEPERER
jgi:predicted dehydrogenase